MFGTHRVAGGETGLESAAKVDQVEHQWDMGGQANRDRFVFGLGRQAEHLAYCLFMCKADYIVDRGTVLRPERRIIGVGKVEWGE